MAKETLNQIPVVDLNDFRDPKRRDSFTETVAKGFQDIGFIFVKTPDITPKLPTVYDAYKKVFDLPLEVKMGYERPDIHRQRGYTPSGAEIGIFCQRSGPDGKPQHDAKARNVPAAIGKRIEKPALGLTPGDLERAIESRVCGFNPQIRIEYQQG